MLSERIKQQDDKIREAKSGTANHESKISDLTKKIKEEENKRKNCEH